MTPEFLYERLFRFAENSLSFVRNLPRLEFNRIYGSQLIRSSSSPGANYIEALEATSSKDFIHKLKICRKEIRESVHWLKLIKSGNNTIEKTKTEANILMSEGVELVRIFTKSILTSENRIKN